MDEILARFVKEAPIAVMVRVGLIHIFSDCTLNQLFERVAETQYTRELTFGTLTRLLTKVVLGNRKSVNAAYRHAEENIPVSVAAVYDKLAGVETRVSQALVEEMAEAMQGLMAALPLTQEDAIPGLRQRTLDGNFLAGTDHRLDCLRDSGAAALPGMSLVVRDGRTGLLTNLIPCEDAYTSERALYPEVLALVQPDDLWLADRNFCTQNYLSGIAEKKAFFLIRHHASAPLEPLGEEQPRGHNETGRLSEQRVRVCGLVCRCIRVRLFKPLRDGTTELRILTNVPAAKASAKRLAELYRTRWQIETAFQELTVNLRCEINTLGYPKAALFAFALAVTAYNLLIVIRAALASGQGDEKVREEVSSYYLAAEVASVTEGMVIAVSAEAWEQFARMTPKQLAGWMHWVAKGINWRRYRKSRRGPKKPTEIKRTRRGAHRSTARLLQKHKKSP